MTQAARAGGAIARRWWRQNPQVWEKPGQGPVSEGDLAVNAAMHAMLMQARPDYGWLSEEGPQDAGRVSREHVFILDPIDGTRAFLAGEENFAVSLGLARAGRMVAGVVYMPAKDRLYTATLDGPALCDGQPIQCSAQAGIEGANVLATGATMQAEHWPGGVPEFRRTFRASLAYRLCLVAEGRYDAMLTLRDAHEWDIAAGCLIADRAGARVTDGQGKAIAFNLGVPVAAGVIAAAPGLHQALMARR